MISTSRDALPSFTGWICFLLPCHKTDSLHQSGKVNGNCKILQLIIFQCAHDTTSTQLGNGAGKGNPLPVSLSSSQPCCLQTLQLFHPYGYPQLTLSSVRLLTYRNTAKSVYEVISLHRFSQGFFKILILQVTKWSCQGKATLHWKSWQRCGRDEWLKWKLNGNLGTQKQMCLVAPSECWWC